MDEKTSEPTTKLTGVARDFFAAAGSNVSDLSELITSTPDENALRAIQKGVDAANKKAVSRAQVIQKWTVLPRDFTIPGGELGWYFFALMHIHVIGCVRSEVKLFSMQKFMYVKVNK